MKIHVIIRNEELIELMQLNANIHTEQLHLTQLAGICTLKQLFSHQTVK